MPVSPLNLKMALIGIAFPADRDSILVALRSNGAPIEILDAVHDLPAGQRFASASDVSHQVADHRLP